MYRLYSFSQSEEEFSISIWGFKNTHQKCRNTVLHLAIKRAYFLRWFNIVLEPVLKSTNILKLCVISCSLAYPRGRQGRSPRGLNSFIFMQFWAKNSLAHPLWELAPMENLGSATDVNTYCILYMVPWLDYSCTVADPRGSQPRGNEKSGRGGTCHSHP